MTNAEEPQSESPPEAPRRKGGGVLSAESAQRLVLVLLALWTLLSGLSLTFFQDAADATIGGGFRGDQGPAAQRLLGVHLLVLAPIYGLIAWDPKRFRLLFWVPYAAQGGVVAATLYDIAMNERSLRGGALPLTVATIFFVLLLYVTFASRQPEEFLPPEEPALLGETPAPTAGEEQPAPAETAG